MVLNAAHEEEEDVVVLNEAHEEEEVVVLHEKQN